MNLRSVLATALLSLFPSLPAVAHDPGISSAHIEVSSDRVELTMTLGASDAGLFQEAFARSGKAKKSPHPPADQLEEVARSLGELQIGKVVLAPTKVSLLDPSEPGEFSVRVCYDLPRGERFEYRALGFGLLPRGHRQLAVALRGSKTLSESILDGKNNVLFVPLK